MNPSNAQLPLDPEKIVAIIKPNGLLSGHLKGFEPREQQQDMLRNIIDAFNHGKIALIEAGTGTGKSIAYLLPAIIWAAKTKERTVISTNTINLQEQLIEKDIPLLLQALNLQMKAVLVKGMYNYICLRKLQEAQEEQGSLPEQERAEIQKIEAWQHTTQKGSRSELPFMPTGGTWDRVAAESDTCNSNKCPHYQQCYFFKARREASEAQLLVSNHHLLFADLARRGDTQNYNNPAVLPVYTRVILDEAHNIEDIATEYFAAHVTRMDVGRLLARLASERNNLDTSGKIPLLKKKMIDHYGKKGENANSEVSSLLTRLNITLPGERRDLFKQMSDTFHAFYEFVRCSTSSVGNQDPANLFQEEAPGDNKLRVLPAHRQTPLWREEITPRVKQMLDSAKRYSISLISLEKDIEKLKDEKLNEVTQGLRFEVSALADRLIGTCTTLESFMSEVENPERVRWIETEQWKTFPNVHLINAELDVSKTLVNYLFNKFPTIVLCSATLTTNKRFDFVRSRLGLTPQLLKDREVTENRYDSPFDFLQQALLAIPKDIPHPDHPQFIEIASEQIFQAIQTSRGNAFVLFTSYAMLTACHQRLIERLRTERYNVFKQGDDARKTLLDNFKNTDRSVLFGTDSFWEGVDVAGEALRCVIIVKLPFKVPKEPLIQARSEVITARGGNAFLEYFVPNAIVKFKQGFGRLIRHKQDRGCIVCLDSRIMTKNYGKLFLNSLPQCPYVYESNEILQKAMQDFYKRTYQQIVKPK